MKFPSKIRTLISFVTQDFAGDEPYFIDIGVLNNTETHITKGFGPPAAVQKTPNILDCNTAVGFWLSWTGNQIKVSTIKLNN